MTLAYCEPTKACAGCGTAIPAEWTDTRCLACTHAGEHTGGWSGRTGGGWPQRWNNARANPRGYSTSELNQWAGQVNCARAFREALAEFVEYCAALPLQA